jgi:hypothetical protein
VTTDGATVAVEGLPSRLPLLRLSPPAPPTLVDAPTSAPQAVLDGPPMPVVAPEVPRSATVVVPLAGPSGPPGIPGAPGEDGNGDDVPDLTVYFENGLI